MTPLADRNRLRKSLPKFKSLCREKFYLPCKVFPLLIFMPVAIYGALLPLKNSKDHRPLGLASKVLEKPYNNI